MEKFKVVFKPSGKTAKVKKGADLLSAAVSCGVYINSSCGGEGVCGRCKVIIKKGKFRMEPTGRISREERKKGYVKSQKNGEKDKCHPIALFEIL